MNLTHSPRARFKVIGTLLVMPGLLTGLILLSPVAASASPGAYGSGPGAAVTVRLSPPSRAVTPASALMRAQFPLQRAADAIRKAATAGRSGYADIVLSVPQHRVTVYWKGAMPGRIARLLARLRSATVRIVVRPARFTAAQVSAEVRRLEASRARYAARGVWLNSFMPRADGSGITVGLAARAGVRPAMAAIRASLRIRSPIPLTFGPAPTIRPLHRLEDLPLHWAGARILDSQNTGSCTTGFPMRRTSDGRTFITTADHCDWKDGHPVNEQYWDWFGPHDINHLMGAAWYHYPPLDIAYLRPPNGWVAGVTYISGVSELDDSSDYVVGVGGNYAGLYLCTSGSFTGENCAITTQGEETTWLNEDNAYITIWYGYEVYGQTAAGNGDSGGPVMTFDSSGNVIAQGSISVGFGNGYSCTNDNGEKTTCSNQIGWVDEQSILNYLGATIVTG
jgi:hypothetical protein